MEEIGGLAAGGKYGVHGNGEAVAEEQTADACIAKISVSQKVGGATRNGWAAV